MAASEAAAVEEKFRQMSLRSGEIEVINLTKKVSKDFISDANLMVIMRGVSGSGKSTIVNTLMEELQTDCVCSADHYFTGRDGVYKFDRSKIRLAHESCQQKAKRYCEEGHSVVIIDNTNIAAWESRHYVGLASTYGYIVVMITPSGHFTTSAQTLATRNKHGVDVDVIRSRLEAYSKITPPFYGWFLSQRSTLELCKLKEEAVSLVRKYGLMDCNYEKHNLIAHMTSIYVQRLEDYQVENVVKKMQDFFGEVESIDVTHIVVTPKTVSARVKLHKLARRIYHNDGGDDNIHSGKPGFDQLPKGNGAHITLGTALGVKNYEARFDMILSHLCEVNRVESKVHEGGKLVCYPQLKLAVMELSDKQSFKAMFAGGYR